MALPIVVGTRNVQIAFTPASVMAGPRDSFVITEPVSIGGQTGIVISGGILSLADSDGLSGHDVAVRLASGNARIVLDRGTVAVGAMGTIAAPGSPTLVAASAGAQDAETSPLVAAVRAFRLSTLELRDSSIHIDLGNGRREVFSDVDVVLSRGRKGTVSAKGTVGVRGQTATFDATLAASAPAAVQGSAAVKLKVTSPLIDIAFDGSARLGDRLLAQGDAAIAMTDGRDVARWLGFDWPSGPGLRDVKISGAIDWNGTAMAFQRARLSMDGNEATGTLSLRITPGRPIINGTLALAVLDLTPYLTNWTSGTNALEAALGRAPGPFALPLAELIDADFRISAERTKARALDFGRGAATLSIKDGKLLADVAELDLFGSRVSGLVTIESAARQPRYVLKTKLAGADLGAIGQAFGGGNAIQGKGDIVADLEARGEWGPEIARSANGTIAFAIKNGGRIGVDFRTIGQLARAKPIQGWSQVRVSDTNIETLDGRLVLTDGLLQAETLTATTADGAINAVGACNLKTGIVDLRISLSGRRALRSEHKALALDSARDAVVVRGRWSEPTFRFEPAAALPSRDAAPTPLAPADGPKPGKS